jgi:hypothetical protein
MKNVVNYCLAHMIHYSYMHVRIKYITQKLSLVGHAHCIDNCTFYIASYTAVLYGITSPTLYKEIFGNLCQLNSYGFLKKIALTV